MVWSVTFKRFMSMTGQWAMVTAEIEADQHRTTHAGVLEFVNIGTGEDAFYNEHILKSIPPGLWFEVEPAVLPEPGSGIVVP